MRKTIIKTILVNIRSLFTINIRKQFHECNCKLNDLEVANNKTKLLTVMAYYATHPDEAISYCNELNYLRSCCTFCPFPYKKTEIPPISYGIDQSSKLPYVLHNDKKLFFPKSLTPIEAANYYINYITVEHLLDKDDGLGKPHQYQSCRFQVECGDILFDIGCAEGLFGLDNIEKVDRLILVESSNQWIEPLRNTFAPYSDRVVIIEKKVSNLDFNDNVSLTSLIQQYGGNSCFIKIDIEGAEKSSICATNFTAFGADKIKIATATYHLQNDYEEIKTHLENNGFTTETSTGFMLFDLYDTPEPPYFRKGIVRGIKKNNINIIK